MTGIEIALIAAGIICICASFFISRKQKPEEDVLSTPASVSAEIWTEKEEEMVQERIHQMFSGEQDKTIANVKEQLERMSNEKIMAVDEFSGQILEKIGENHKEVIFMYNMLNNKQNEIKKMMEDANIQEKALRETMKNQRSQTTQVSHPSAEKVMTSAPRTQQRPEQGVTENGSAVGSRRVTQADSLRVKKPNPVKDGSTGAAQTAISRMEAANAAKRARQKRETEQQSEQTMPVRNENTSSVGQERTGRSTAPAAPEYEDVNQKIRKMYKEGKSVLEISKALNIGQGEVKLVIALYGGKMR